MIRPAKIGGKVVDWRDSSVFTINIQSNTSILLSIKFVLHPVFFEVTWGDGKANSYSVANPPASPGFVRVTHTYTPGIYNLSIKSSQEIEGLTAVKIIKYNAGFRNAVSSLRYIYSYDSTSTQSLNSYIVEPVEYILLKDTSIGLDLGKITLSPTCNTLNIAGTVPNVTGLLKSSTVMPNITSITYFGNVNNGGIYSFNQLFKNTPNCNSYDFQRIAATGVENSDLTEMAMIVKDRPITRFLLLYISDGISGSATQLFKQLYETPTNGSIYLNSTTNAFTLELGTQAGERYADTPKIIFLNGIEGDVSNFNFKYNALFYLWMSFSDNAYGNINKISNVKQNSPLSALALITNNVSLDISNLSLLNFTEINLSSGINNFYGDISWLGTKTFCNSFVLSGIKSTAITGWNNLITNIYNNRATFLTNAKRFNCPSVMKSALSGTYQAPSGFVKGNADGNPTTDRERIYVLVNNHNWTFTNI